MRRFPKVVPLFFGFLLSSIPIVYAQFLEAGSQGAHSMEKMGMGIGMEEANRFTINGRSAPAIPPLKVKKDEWVRIRFINAGNRVHPMHLHAHSFKIFSTDGCALSNKGQMKDTLPANPGERYDVIFEADNPGT